jgi:lipopolysaccharide biosynthesis glycosyltransferase
MPPASPDTVLVFTIDQGYAMPLAVALASVAASAAPGERIRVIVLHEGVDAETQAKVTDPLAGSAVEVEWRAGASDSVAGLHTTDRFSHVVWFRLVLPETLSDLDGRVLFLDADLVVEDSLAPLFTRDIGSSPIAAVPDAVFPFVGCAPGLPNWHASGLDAHAPYCNAGVMLIDLVAWRDADLTARTIAYASERRAESHYLDQDAINAVLGGTWHGLEPRWNQQPDHRLPYGVVHLAHSYAELQAAADDPAIIHYASVDKPWHPGCSHPDVDRWRAALDRTAWAGWTPGVSARVRRYRRRVRQAARTIVRG